MREGTPLKNNNDKISRDEAIQFGFIEGAKESATRLLKVEGIRAYLVLLTQVRRVTNHLLLDLFLVIVCSVNFSIFCLALGIASIQPDIRVPASLVWTTAALFLYLLRSSLFLIPKGVGCSIPAFSNSLKN